MREAEYTRLAERESTYWWHVGRLRIIETYLRRIARERAELRILNVGCGTGGTVPTLGQFGVVENVDVSDLAIDLMRRQGHDRVKKMDGSKLPYPSNSFDVVGAFDVLEHIKSEAAALAEWGRVLKDDGTILLTVPAYQWLWSGHDVAVQHFRRYTRRRLQHVAAAAGFTVTDSSYAFVFSFPLVAGFRVLQRIPDAKAAPEATFVDLPGWVNTTFTNLLYLEAKAHRFISFPFGTSVIASLRRDERMRPTREAADETPTVAASNGRW